MVALVATIHVLQRGLQTRPNADMRNGTGGKAWMVGKSPTMTAETSGDAPGHRRQTPFTGAKE